MASIFISHRVADFDQWKPLFDEHESARKQASATGHSLHRDPDDPNTVIVAVRVTDLSRAKAFAESQDLRDTMARAGVQGPPTIWFGEDVEEKTY